MLRAYHKIILPNGEEHNMVVCRFDDGTGTLIEFHHLEHEEPFVEWVGGIMDMKKEP